MDAVTLNELSECCGRTYQIHTAESKHYCTIKSHPFFGLVIDKHVKIGFWPKLGGPTLHKVRDDYANYCCAPMEEEMHNYMSDGIMVFMVN